MREITFFQRLLDEHERRTVVLIISLSLLYAAADATAYRTSLAFWYPPKLITRATTLTGLRLSPGRIRFIAQTDA